jgi:ribonuclease HI
MVPISFCMAPLALTGMYKVNWDAAVDKNIGRLGFGIVVRDFEGAVVAARSTTNNFLVTPMVAKALAAYHVVEFCNEMGFADIIFE